MGTDAWRNWQAFVAGEPEREAYDDEAQSDVMFTGGPVSFGPYALHPVYRDVGEASVGPALIIHVASHADLMPPLVVEGELAPTDSSAYHGGATSDEIAALVSLELGVRLRVAGTLRMSGLHEHVDLPPLHLEVPRLPRPGRPGREVLPRAVMRPALLTDVVRLGTFPAIDEKSQVELVRAARAYASALWWANEDPNLAWLLLVTAVETAASRRRLARRKPVDLLREEWPEMWEAVRSAPEGVSGAVARLLVGQMRATRRFVDCVVAWSPPPEEPRSPTDQVDWDDLADHAELIYSYRSTSLHGGKPFPAPMLEVPRVEPDGAVQEAPWGLTSGTSGGSWTRAETPMLLSTFEHITRGILLRWWDELAS